MVNLMVIGCLSLYLIAGFIVLFQCEAGADRRKRFRRGFKMFIKPTPFPANPVCGTLDRAEVVYLRPWTTHCLLRLRQGASKPEPRVYRKED